MSKDKREGWLRNLKVGDTVVVNIGGERSVRKVEKVTPTGKMDVGGRRYEPDGWNRSGVLWASLREPTDQALARVRLTEAMWRAHDCESDKITGSNAEAVNVALDKLAEALGVTL